MMWTGAVFTDSENRIGSFCVPCDESAGKLNSVCPSLWKLLFAVSGPDQDEVTAIVTAVCGAAESLSLPGPHQAANTPCVAGSFYVYAYFDHGNATWEHCFYVGKGIVKNQAPYLGRWTEHIKETLNEAPTSHNLKMRRIHAWIVEAGLAGRMHQDVRHAAAGSHVRKLYVFDGRYAESQAFYVEYFLISHALGTHSVANDTNGNLTCGQCSAIAQPKHLRKLCITPAFVCLT